MTTNLLFKKITSNITLMMFLCCFLQTSVSLNATTYSDDEMEEYKLITGSVVDAEGIPLIGVNILIVGKAEGTITDIDGNFSIDVDQGDRCRAGVLARILRPAAAHAR